jgi:hypothetical protein
VIAWTREPQWTRDEARFDALALALFAFQFAHCAPYRRFCEAARPHARDVRAGRTSRRAHGAFKELSLTSFPRERAVHVFRTSGTTDPTRARSAAARHARSLRGVAARVVRARCLPDLAAGSQISLQVLAPSTTEASDSSLSHMFDTVMRDAGSSDSGHWVARGSLDAPRALRALEAAERSSGPVAICGTAFAFVHLLEELDGADDVIRCRAALA